MQARIEKQKKDSRYFSESLKYWNREMSHKRGRERIAGGLSRAKSDAYVTALYALGRGRREVQSQSVELAKLTNAAGSVTQSGESVARGAGRGKVMEILRKQARVESGVRSAFGPQMDGKMTKIHRYQRRALARNKEALGVFPEYGAPVMMPPKGDTTMANIGMMLSIASTAISLSDAKLKENIQEVGQSPKGYKIYEFNYKSNKNTRYRGAMAQNVVKINPMAVGIRHNYLTVDYSKIDVNMEVVS